MGETITLESNLPYRDGDRSAEEAERDRTYGIIGEDILVHNISRLCKQLFDIDLSFVRKLSAQVSSSTENYKGVYVDNRDFSLTITNKGRTLLSNQDCEVIKKRAIGANGKDYTEDYNVRVKAGSIHKAIKTNSIIILGNKVDCPNEKFMFLTSVDAQWILDNKKLSNEAYEEYKPEYRLIDYGIINNKAWIDLYSPDKKELKQQIKEIIKYYR